MIPGLIAHWTADGTTRDITGGHPATLEGGAAYAPGRFGQAFSFPVPGAYVDIPYRKDFDFAPTSQFTVAVWVQAHPLGKYQAVVVKATQAGDWNWGIIIDRENHFYTGHTAHDVAQSTTTVQAGVWNHVAVTYGGGDWKMYVNGVLENQAAGVPLTQSGGGLALGHKGGKPAQVGDPDWFQGRMDDVRLYNRALSATDIQTLFHAHIPATN